LVQYDHRKGLLVDEAKERLESDHAQFIVSKEVR
jgi:hypothetical protein